MERVVRNALSWARCHRLWDKPIRPLDFPAFLISASAIVQVAS